ncbi:hypothetical protein [Mycoplasmopsis verecunda]|uniref:Uncharacterized protein n=1 Tax=Mycoplasmopsis verecunda TaxID=171291 RepID=A0A1T4KEH5_9BACT|nr:hypothetical protein [Mycoplasmopsis verecunda]WPB54871.1 hypothetical protein SAM46_01805 [Mycoplasmopsis verecunda]SJZ40755.1 hypothetical protein SAMN02745154_00019 [Mycoplasmopsis verecunda]
MQNNKRKISNFFLAIAYKSQYRKILNKINFTYQKFYELNLIKTKKLEKLESDKFAKRSADLNDFIQSFNDEIEFCSNVTEAQKQMIFNFYYYLFYDLFIKYYNRDELEVKNYLGETFSRIHLDNDKKKRKQQFKIIVNKIKREYYYLFLDEFQKIDGYNTVLRAILRKVL